MLTGFHEPQNPAKYKETLHFIIPMTSNWGATGILSSFSSAPCSLRFLTHGDTSVILELRRQAGKL